MSRDPSDRLAVRGRPAGRRAWPVVVPVFLPFLFLSLFLPLFVDGLASTVKAQEGMPSSPEESPPGASLPSPSAAIAARLSEGGSTILRNSAAESGLDSVRVDYGDGRPREGLVVFQREEGPYLSLGDFGRIVGSGFRWDPETWRGSFRVDSLEVAFVLDTPVFWIGEEAVLLPSPVRYAEERILVPLSLVDGVLLPLMGDRCQWDPATGRLLLTHAQPWLETVELGGGRSGASLTLGPVPDGATRFRWDPMGSLRIELKGVHPSPGTRGTGKVEGIAIASLTSTTRGTELLLRLDSQWVGIRIRRGRSEGTQVLDFTSSAADVERGRFESLRRYLDPRRPTIVTGPGRQVLLELSSSMTGETAEEACLIALADRLRQLLEQDFGHHVLVVPDRSLPGQLRSPAGLPETPAVPEGDCWVGLRLEDWPSAGTREFLLVVPGPPAKQEPLALQSEEIGAPPVSGEAGTGSDEPPWRTTRAVPWGQVPRLYRSASNTLARTMAEHLNSEWEGRPVRIVPRPARIFRGVAMPAVLIYPAAAGDEEAATALCDETRAAELARNLAFALDEFLLGLAGE